MLNQFERAKDWSDLINWLQKVGKALKKCKTIPHRETLSKRLGILFIIILLLAQCLNQTFPNGVHMLTLKIYSFIFKRFQVGVWE